MAPESAAGPLPSGYGAAVATNGLGQELWRYLICERCGALIANEARYVQLHDKFHGVTP